MCQRNKTLLLPALLTPWITTSEWTEESSCLWYLNPVVVALIWYCREPRWTVERIFLIWHVWWTARCTTGFWITAFCHLSQLVSRLARLRPVYHAGLSVSNPISQQGRCSLESNCFGQLTKFPPHMKHNLVAATKSERERDKEDLWSSVPYTGNAP